MREASRGQAGDDPAPRGDPGIARQHHRHQVARRRGRPARVAVDGAVGNPGQWVGDLLQRHLGMPEKPAEDRLAQGEDQDAQDQHDQKGRQEDRQDQPGAVLQKPGRREAPEDARRQAEGKEQNAHAAGKQAATPR